MSVTVVYTLSAGGDLDRELPSLTVELKDLREEAKKTQDAVKDLGDKGGQSFGDFAQGAQATAEIVASIGGAIHEVLKSNDRYANSIAHLADEFGRMGERVADAIGPKVADLVDEIGLRFVFLGNLIPNEMSVAYQFMQDGLRDVVTFTEEVIRQLQYMWGQFRSGQTINLDQVLMDLQGANALLVIDTLDAIDKIKAGWDDAADAMRDAYKRQKVDIVSEGKAPEPPPVASGPDYEGRRNMEQAHRAPFEEKTESEEVAEAVKTSGAETAAAVVDAIGGGLSGVMESFAGGPITLLIEGVLDILRDPTILTGLFMDVLDIYTNLDDMIAGVLGSVLPNLIDDGLPKLIAGFATLGPAVAVALVEAAPDLFAAVIVALLELPDAFADAMKELFKDIEHAVTEPFSKGGVFETHIGKGPDTFLGIPLSKRHEGGLISTEGLYHLRPQERVLAPSQQRTSHSSQSLTIGAIHMHGVQDVPAMVEAIRRELGPYAAGLKLSPFAGG